MFEPGFIFTVIARLRARRHPAASRRANPIGDTMSSHIATTRSPARRRAYGRIAAALISLLAPTVLAVVPLVGAGTAAALACACGCSVFDVGGLDTPQEQDHGGRVFFEFWSGDQTENYIGSSRASNAANTDKEINTQWYNVGFEYSFNRDWGVMVRVPTTNRALTTETDVRHSRARFKRSIARDIGDIEVMGMYTGFFPDMSTGVIFGLKFPTGPYTAPGHRPRHPDRHGLDRPDARRLSSRHAHRRQRLAVFLAGDVATAVPLPATPPTRRASSTAMPASCKAIIPECRSMAPPASSTTTGTTCSASTRSRRSAQVIVSHRNADSGTGADPFNSGFDRVMLSPGIEFTKVLDEANNRVLKTYFDIEVPVYYRGNAANNAGTEGQLVAPYLIRVVTSYNF